METFLSRDNIFFNSSKSSSSKCFYSLHWFFSCCYCFLLSVRIFKTNPFSFDLQYLCLELKLTKDNLYSFYLNLNLKFKFLLINWLIEKWNKIMKEEEDLSDEKPREWKKRECNNREGRNKLHSNLKWKWKRSMMSQREFR